MAKQQIKKSTSKNNQKEIGFSFDKFIPEKFQTPALLILLLLLILIFFSPITFGDKTTSSGDLIQVKSLREYALKDRESTSLWNPHIFCGMPAVVTSMSPRWYDLSVLIYSYASRLYTTFFTEYNALYTFNFVLLAFTSFFFMRSFKIGRGISFLVAAATTFSSGIVMLFYIGHVTKLASLAIFPFILMMLFKFQREIKRLDVLLFIFGMHLLVFGAHVQIVFYFGLVVLLYFVFYFIRSFVIKDKQLQKQLFKSLGISIGAAVIALLMSFDTYSQILEYKPYSTRGTKSIAEQQNPSLPAQSDSYEYNTRWSFSPGEVFTFIIPSYYGFGTSTYKGPLTQDQELQVHTYFGQMESVDMAMYMGIVIIALALFALFTRRKEPLIQFMGILVILFLLMSFGKNFPLIFNLFYNFFPMFNNFRAPTMILHILQIIFPLLAGFGVMKILSIREEKDIRIINGLKYVSIAFAGLFVFSLILSGGIINWFTERISAHTSSMGDAQQTQYFTALSPYIAEMFAGDVQIAFALLALTFGLSFAFASSKINKEFLVAGLVILIVFDLFRIGHRGANYIDASQVEELFKEPQYILTIKQQNDKEPYRIINLKQQGMGNVSNNANFNVYFLQEDLSGYSAVKPRTYQDILETAGPVNVTLWRMLGVKYIVADRVMGVMGFTQIEQSENEFVYKNENALPRIYFVDSVAQKTAPEILDALKNDAFDPKHVAFVDKLDFNFDKAGSASTAKIVQYKDELVVAEVNSSGNNFLFFGTTYTPAWKALIDGNETKIYKTNHGFQGIVVPQGNHKIEFVYEPKGFVIGKSVSLILNILLLGSIAAMVIGGYFRRKKNQ